MWKFFKNLIRVILNKKRKSIKFEYNGRKVKAVAIGKDVTMKIEQPNNMPKLDTDELDEILMELARRLK
jgi:hypothetical protein